MSKGPWKPKRGRKRRFKFGDISVDRRDGQLRVIVDYRMRGTKAEYAGIPMNGRHERFGPAQWVSSSELHTTGKSSKTASVRTYRANNKLEEEVGRGCRCHCCIHTAIPGDAFSIHTGEMREGYDE
jgi:hypothetical protein